MAEVMSKEKLRNLALDLLAITSLTSYVSGVIIWVVAVATNIPLMWVVAGICMLLYGIVGLYIVVYKVDR